MVRLRGELEKLIVTQASKMSNKSHASAYKASQYEELLAAVMVSYFDWMPRHSLKVNVFLEWHTKSP